MVHEDGSTRLPQVHLCGLEPFVPELVHPPRETHNFGVGVSWSGDRFDHGQNPGVIPYGELGEQHGARENEKFDQDTLRQNIRRTPWEGKKEKTTSGGWMGRVLGVFNII